MLDYELVVQPSINAAEALKGKSIGISRFGSVTDVAVRAFLAELKLRPGADVTLRQVGAPRSGGGSKQGGRCLFIVYRQYSPFGRGIAASSFDSDRRLKRSAAFSLDLRRNNQELCRQAREREKVVMSLIEPRIF